MTRVWPVTLSSIDRRGVQVVLRPLVRRDESEWGMVRRENAAWVSRWEPTAPDGAVTRTSFRTYVRTLDREGREVRGLPFAIEVDGRLAGQMHLFGIIYGSLLSGSAGYWVSRRVAGQGVATRALAMLCDHAFGAAGLHRVEVNIRPENGASLAVVRHLGFRDEGMRMRYLHIEGDWRDHRSFALTREDLDGQSVLSRWGGAPPPEGRVDGLE